MKTIQSIIAILVLIAFTLSAQAQSVPSLVNYQGKLSNPDGSPLSTADYQLTFNIYDATNGGNLIWGPQIFDGTPGQGHGSKIPVVQGYFNVMLGPADTNGTSLANAFTNSNSFVQITVSNHNPILPRQQILSAPFAFQAANSAKLAGSDWSAVFGTNDPVNGKIPGTNLANGAVTAAQIATGGIQTSNLADFAVTLQKLAPRAPGTNVPVGGIAVSLPISSQTLTGSGSGSFQDIANLSVTLQTTGRPVLAFLAPGTVQTNNLTPLNSLNSGVYYSGIASQGWLQLVRDNNQAFISTKFGNHSGDYLHMWYPTPLGLFLDFPQAGTHTYKVRWGFYSDNSSSANIYDCVLVVIEL